MSYIKKYVKVSLPEWMHWFRMNETITTARKGKAALRRPSFNPTLIWSISCGSLIMNQSLIESRWGYSGMGGGLFRATTECVVVLCDLHLSILKARYLHHALGPQELLCPLRSSQWSNPWRSSSCSEKDFALCKCGAITQERKTIGQAERKRNENLHWSMCIETLI